MARVCVVQCSKFLDLVGPGRRAGWQRLDGAAVLLQRSWFLLNKAKDHHESRVQRRISLVSSIKSGHLRRSSSSC